MDLYVDYEWCSGCHACELACKQEHDLKTDEWGIRVIERMYRGKEKVVIEYVPIPTEYCDFCLNRVRQGQETRLCSSLHDQVHGIRSHGRNGQAGGEEKEDRGVGAHFLMLPRGVSGLEMTAEAVLWLTVMPLSAATTGRGSGPGW